MPLEVNTITVALRSGNDEKGYIEIRIVMETMRDQRRDFDSLSLAQYYGLAFDIERGSTVQDKEELS